MELENFGVNDDSLKEIQALFEEDVEQTNSPTADGNTEPSQTDDKQKDVSQTKAFAKRLAEERSKIVNEERENIAKSLGYNSYEELQRSKERKLYEDKGLDPDEVSPIVEELVKQKLDSDPRMKELQKFKEKQVEEFAKKELAEIAKLTDGEITKLEQIPPEVLDLWKTKGSLKQAYIELKGEELIMKSKSVQSRGSTAHLNGLSGNANANETKRHLTAQERQLWKFFNPKLTDEELDKKMVDK